MKKLIVGALLALSACATTPPKPVIQQHLIYCVTPDQYAALVNAQPSGIGNQLTGNAQEDFKLSAAQNVALRIYANGLLEVIGGCIGPAPEDA